MRSLLLYEMKRRRRTRSEKGREYVDGALSFTYSLIPRRDLHWQRHHSPWPIALLFSTSVLRVIRPLRIPRLGNHPLLRPPFQTPDYGKNKAMPKPSSPKRLGGIPTGQTLSGEPGLQKFGQQAYNPARLQLCLPSSLLFLDSIEVSPN